MNFKNARGNKRKFGNYLIKKRFQTNFILRFCVLVIIACAIMGVLTYLLTENATTTSFENLRLTVKSTADFIFPALLLSSLAAMILVSIATIFVFTLLSHRIAGPIYRIERALEDIGKGDLRAKLRLRKKDEIKNLGEGINDMLKNITGPIGYSQSETKDLEKEIIAARDKMGAKEPSPAELEPLLDSLAKRIKEIRKNLSYFKLSSIALIFMCLSAAGVQANVQDGIPPAELLSDDGWRITRSAFCTIYFKEDVDIEAINNRLDTYKIDYGLSKKPAKTANDPREEIAYKFDLIFSKVQQILDMRPPALRLNIRIYRAQENLDSVYMEIFNEGNEFIAFYIFKINTLFASQMKISANIIAHEIAHCVVDNYFSVIPPKKIAEMIAQYADAHLTQILPFSRK